MGIWKTWTLFYLLVTRSRVFYVRSLVNLSYLVLLCWALLASKALWRVSVYLGWWMYWGMRVAVSTTVKKILPRFQHTTTMENAVVWDDQLNIWNWVDNRDMDMLLRKEEDTRVFRFARRRTSKRRGWILESSARKAKMGSMHIRSLRVHTTFCLFSSAWQKHYSVVMRRRLAAQSTCQRLRLWIKRSPCLWKSLQTLNVSVSLSNLISMLDVHPN